MCRNLELVEYPKLWMHFLKVPTSQLTLNTLKPKWIHKELYNQAGTHYFHGCITFQFHIL